MNDLSRCTAYLLVALAVAGCGSPSATDYLTPDRSNVASSGGTGAHPGGSGGSQQAGAGGMPQAGAGGVPQAGAGGVPQAGAGGMSQAGAGGMSASGGVAGFGTGGAAGTGSSTGGTGSTEPISCGGLFCFAGQQYCRHDLPEMVGGPEQYSCLPFPDSCSTLDCSCFSASGCMCSGEKGRITLVCPAD